MTNLARVRLKKLTSDLGTQRVLRLVSIFLLGLFVTCFAIWLGRTAYDKPIPDWLSTGSAITGVLLVVVTILMVVNFDNIKKTQTDLRELLEEAKEQADLLVLLRPMVADAFLLDPNQVRPALVERLIESVINELTNDHSATSRNFLQRQPEAVKELVRDRSTSNVRSRQVEFARRLDAAERSNQLVPQHEIELLVDAMAKARGVLNLIPNQFPEVQVSVPAGARTGPEPTPFHVAEAHT